MGVISWIRRFFLGEKAGDLGRCCAVTARGKRCRHDATHVVERIYPNGKRNILHMCTLHAQRLRQREPVPVAAGMMDA